MTARGDRHLALDRLTGLATAVASAPHLWRPWVRYDPVHRWHVRLWAARDHEVWLLCWTAGQRVELHDHGGSAGAFCVADGQLVEEHLRPDGRGVPRRVRCPTGTARAFPPARLHGVRNPGRAARDTPPAWLPRRCRTSG